MLLVVTVIIVLIRMVMIIIRVIMIIIKMNIKPQMNQCKQLNENRYFHAKLT